MCDTPPCQKMGLPPPTLSCKRQLLFVLYYIVKALEIIIRERCYYSSGLHYSSRELNQFEATLLYIYPWHRKGGKTRMCCNWMSLGSGRRDSINTIWLPSSMHTTDTRYVENVPSRCETIHHASIKSPKGGKYQKVKIRLRWEIKLSEILREKERKFKVGFLAFGVVTSQKWIVCAPSIAVFLGLCNHRWHSSWLAVNWYAGEKPASLFVTLGTLEEGSRHQY